MNEDIVELVDINFVDPCKNSVYAEKKYVEVNEAIKTIRNASPTKVWDALQVLAEMGGADVTPVVHAYWKQVSEKYPRYVCTACNHLYNNKEYKHCPFCGAIMSMKGKKGKRWGKNTM